MKCTINQSPGCHLRAASSNWNLLVTIIDPVYSRCSDADGGALEMDTCDCPEMGDEMGTEMRDEQHRPTCCTLHAHIHGHRRSPSGR